MTSSLKMSALVPASQDYGVDERNIHIWKDLYGFIGASFQEAEPQRVEKMLRRRAVLHFTSLYMSIKGEDVRGIHEIHC